MALAYVLTDIFIMLVGGALLYIGMKRNAFVWFLIASVIFISNVQYSMTIPFQTNASGEVVGTSANIMLAGINLILFFISLIFTLRYAFEIYKLTFRAKF